MQITTLNILLNYINIISLWHTRQHLHIVSILRGVAFANSLPNLRLLIRPGQDIPPQNSIENIFKKPNNSPLQNDRTEFFVFLKNMPIFRVSTFRISAYERMPLKNARKVFTARLFSLVRAVRPSIAVAAFLVGLIPL